MENKDRALIAFLGSLVGPPLVTSAVSILDLSLLAVSVSRVNKIALEDTVDVLIEQVMVDFNPALPDSVREASKKILTASINEIISSKEIMESDAIQRYLSQINEVQKNMKLPSETEQDPTSKEEISTLLDSLQNLINGEEEDG